MTDVVIDEGLRTAVTYVFAFGILALVIGVAHYVVAYERTGNDRIKATELIIETTMLPTADIARARALNELMKAVTYGQHQRARFFFRDPWLLYPNEIRRLMGAKESIPSDNDQEDAVLL